MNARNILMTQYYSDCCMKQSDINEHLPILKYYASLCSHVTEFGVREGNSTIALACGTSVGMTSYDVNYPALPQNIIDSISSEIDFYFVKSNVLDVEISETDLLFIDTFHTYDQLTKELDLHAPKVKKFIFFHDTETFGRTGEDGKCKGIMDAIEEFLVTNNQWHVCYVRKNNNGLIGIDRWQTCG